MLEAISPSIAYLSDNQVPMSWQIQHSIQAFLIAFMRNVTYSSVACRNTSERSLIVTIVSCEAKAYNEGIASQVDGWSSGRAPGIAGKRWQFRESGPAINRA